MMSGGSLFGGMIQNMLDTNRWKCNTVLNEGDKVNECIIDTCLVHDANKPYETGISDPHYNEGGFIIVEDYDTKEEAEAGHEKWVNIMSNEKPEFLADILTSTIGRLLAANQLVHPREGTD